MRAHFGLPSVESEEMDSKRPITVNFEIPYFTVSGIQVGRYIHSTLFFVLFGGFLCLLHNFFAHFWSGLLFHICTTFNV